MEEDKVEYEVPDNPNLEYTIVRKKDDSKSPVVDSDEESYEMLRYKEEMVSEKIENLRSIEDVEARKRYRDVLEQNEGIKITDEQIGLVPGTESYIESTEANETKMGSKEIAISVVLGFLLGIIGVLISWVIYKERFGSKDPIIRSVIGWLLGFVISLIVISMNMQFFV